MKQITFLLFLLFTTCVTELKAQTTNKSFNILWGELVTTSEYDKGYLYENVIKNANLEPYRLKTKRDTITFDNGFKVELLSAQELFILGEKIDINNYSDTRESRYTKPTFRIVIPTGSLPQAPGQQPYIIALYNHIEK